MSSGRPITEEDLHAYVDQALDAGRQAEVAAYLEQYPDVARRVEGYAEHRAGLRDMLAPHAAEPVPPELTLATLVERRRRASFHAVPWRAAAAALVLLVLGGTGGWSLRGMTGPHLTGAQITTILAQEAVDSYRVFGPDHTHPVEIKADDKAELTDWLSSRLQHPLAVPDLSAAGYRFMGGRLVSTSHGAAGMLMYDDGHGMRIVVLIRPMTVPSPDTPMLQHDHGDLTGFAWIDRGMGYSLTGPTSADILHPLANAVRKQIDPEAT
jgi:anti-sigma factor RsiW